MYNPNCKACKFLVYWTPFIAWAGVAVVGTMYLGLKWLISAIIILPIAIPLVIYTGKRLPMMHEYFK